MRDVIILNGLVTFMLGCCFSSLLPQPTSSEEAIPWHSCYRANDMGCRYSVHAINSCQYMNSMITIMNGSCGIMQMAKMLLYISYFSYMNFLKNGFVMGIQLL
jgi:hypothetical protein